MQVRQKYNGNWQSINIDLAKENVIDVEIEKRKTLLTDRKYIKVEINDEKARGFLALDFTEEQLKQFADILNEYVSKNMQYRLGSKASKLDKKIIKEIYEKL